MEKNIGYPRNSEVNKFVDYATDKKINETMSEVTKLSAQKIAGYLDFISGYWPDYEKHIAETEITAADLREASGDHPTLNGKRWDFWPVEIHNKLLKHARNEKAQRMRTVAEMRVFLQKQQETMQHYTPEGRERMEALQDKLAA